MSAELETQLWFDYQPSADKLDLEIRLNSRMGRDQQIFVMPKEWKKWPFCWKIKSA